MIKSIKLTSVAIMILIFSTQTYATQDRSDEPNAAKAAPSPLDLIEKEVFANIITESIRTQNVEKFSNIIKEYETRGWFSQKALEWSFKMAANNSFASAVELLLDRTDELQISQECISEIFTDRPVQEVYLAIIRSLVKRPTIHPLLTQDVLEDAFPKFAARGQMVSLQCLMNLPKDGFVLSDTCRLRSMKSAACDGELAVVEFLLKNTREQGLLTKRHLNEMFLSTVVGHSISTHSQDKLKSIRNVINFLLNMNADGPDQDAVDSTFRQLSWARNDINIVKIMLLDRQTGTLRTGLRPTNATIRSEQNQFLNDDIRAFLASLVL